jgi:hypothetical protein
MRRTRADQRAWRRIATWVSVGFAASLVTGSCQPTGPLPTATAFMPSGTATATFAPSALSSPAPTRSQGPGSIVDGVPTTFDGLPVLRGDALRAAVAASSDATPFLAGGWFQSIYSHISSYCSAVVSPRAVDRCGNNVLLYDEQVGWTRTELTGGETSIVRDLLTMPVDRPAVLLLHTHDPACVDAVAKGFDCAHLPVVSMVEWTGAIATDRPSPTPVGTPPATTVSRAKAIALARPHAGERAGLDLRVRCVAVAPYSSVWSLQLPPPQPDEWLWSIVFVGGRWASDKVSLDNSTGTLMSAAGDDWVQSCIGDGAPAP